MLDFDSATLIIYDNFNGGDVFSIRATEALYEPVDDWCRETFGIEWEPDSPADLAYDILRKVDPGIEMLDGLNVALSQIGKGYSAVIEGVCIE